MFKICLLSSIFVAVIFIDSVSHVRADESPINMSGKNVRAFMVIPRYISVKQAFWLLEKGVENHFNTLVFRITNNLNIANAPSPISDNEWTPDELGQFIAKAKANDLDVVLEIKLLSHQEKLFEDSYPDLMWNSVTYNPLNNGVYDLIFPYLEYLVKKFKPIAIHIGHDEVAGHNMVSRKRWLSLGEKILPAELYLLHVKAIHERLQLIGVDTWMWADMLLGADEFPTMSARHLKGNVEGYGAELRQEIPKSIVLVDWHYHDVQDDFPSTKRLVEEGFTVIGAVWKQRAAIDNFPKYASKNGAAGMLLTLWGMMHAGHKDSAEILFQAVGTEFLEKFSD